MKESKIEMMNELRKALTQVGLRIASIRMNMSLIHLELNKVVNCTNQLEKEDTHEKEINIRRKAREK